MELTSFALFCPQKGEVGLAASELFDRPPKPVRAILFDKSAETNWSLGWHQDRTICVKQRREAPGFGPWTVKQGYHHVAPPFELLERMVTLRVHLDDVPATNAPLKVALGSHLFGQIAEKDIEDTIRRCDLLECLAKAGDIWAYSTPIAHASDAAETPTNRRVLQVDYSADELPHDLRWLEV